MDNAHNVAVGFADYNHDGRVDAVTATTDGSNVVLHENATNVTGRHFLTIGVHENAKGGTGGVGARVAVKTGDLIQFNDITGGSSRASQNEHSVTFGLDGWDGAELVVVRFADGSQIVRRNVKADQFIRLAANGNDLIDDLGSGLPRPKPPSNLRIVN